MKEEIIFPESDKAASIQRANVKEWVSRHGRFYGHDEQAARWDGATHIHCRICGQPTPKIWLICKKCREEKAALKYSKFPLIVWNEETPVYSQVTNRYYWSREEVRDENPKGIFDPVSLQLVSCKPIYAKEIDPESYYEDLLPEYEDLNDISEDLVDIFQELNDALNEARIVLSYEPTKIAIV